MVDSPLIPCLYPERLLHSRRRSGLGRYSTVANGPRIPRERWPEVAVRAQVEVLRAVARDFGVSYETVRSVGRTITTQERVP